MRNVQFAVILLAAIVLCRPALAEGCMASDEWTEAVRAKNPDLPITRVVEMPAATAARAVEIYNESIESPITAGRAVVILGAASPGGVPALVGFFRDDCLVGEKSTTIPTGEPS